MPEQQQAEQMVAALAAYQAQTQQLRESLRTYIERLWASLGSWRAKDIRPFTRQVTPFVAGAQRQMVSLTAANLAQQKQITLGGRLQPAPVNPKQVTGAAARNGVPPAEVYERPFHTVWRKLDELPHESEAVDQAIKAGLDQALSEALTDVQLAKTHTVQDIGRQDEKIAGYRRVLEGTYSCGKCIVASTFGYGRGNLLPIHPGCDCSVQVVYGDFPIKGLTINQVALEQVHAAVAAQFGQSSAAARDIPGAFVAGRPIRYQDLLIVHEHGELGPILAVRGQQFTGPADLVLAR